MRRPAATSVLAAIDITTRFINHRGTLGRIILWCFLWPFLLILVAVKWAIRHPLLTGTIVFPGILLALGRPWYAVAVLATTLALTPVLRLAWPQWRERWAAANK